MLLFHGYGSKHLKKWTDLIKKKKKILFCCSLSLTKYHSQRQNVFVSSWSRYSLVSRRSWSLVFTVLTKMLPLHAHTLADETLCTLCSAGSKPFMCKICNFATAQLGDARNHVKRHLGMREYKCHICGWVQSLTVQRRVQVANPQCAGPSGRQQVSLLTSTR